MKGERWVGFLFCWFGKVGCDENQKRWMVVWLRVVSRDEDEEWWLVGSRENSEMVRGMIMVTVWLGGILVVRRRW